MENLGLYVLNGCAIGDIPGRWTYHNANGSSIIDYAWGNMLMLESTIKFEVTETIITSNHGICTVFSKDLSFTRNSLLANTRTCNSDEGKYTVNFKFNNLNCIFYKNILERSHNIYYNSDNVDNLNDNLLNTIKEAACHSGIMQVNKKK